MNKKNFTAPVMEITKWEVEDIVTASDISVKSYTGDLSGASSSSTKTISYSDFNS